MSYSLSKGFGNVEQAQKLSQKQLAGASRRGQSFSQNSDMTQRDLRYPLIQGIHTFNLRCEVTAKI